MIVQSRSALHLTIGLSRSPAEPAMFSLAHSSTWASVVLAKPSPLYTGLSPSINIPILPLLPLPLPLLLPIPMSSGPIILGRRLIRYRRIEWVLAILGCLMSFPG